MFSPVEGAAKEVTKCWRCDGSLEEQFSKRNVMEVVTGLVRIGGGHISVKVKNQRSMLAPSYVCLLCYILQAIFRHDTIGVLRLGHRMVIVYTVETLKTGEVILEVLSVTPSPLNIIPHLEFECPPIEKLFRDRRQSPWSFVISLAYMMGVLAAPRL